MRKRHTYLWIGLTLLGSLPFMALMGFGGWWLWQQQLLILWLTIAASCSGLAWILARLLRTRHSESEFNVTPTPSLFASPVDKQAWQAVASLSEQLKQEINPTNSTLETWLQIGQRVLAVVAKLYRPETKNPELDIPITQLLRIIEHVSHDLHQQLGENLPLSHVVTLADGLNLKAWLAHFKQAKTVLRLGRMLLNPLSGILNEAKTYAEDKVLDLTLPRLNNWLLELYVQKVAEYAILLYSGRLAVSTDKLTALSNLSQQDQKLAQDQATGPQEPLRILVAGQINAGKSSLINHLFAQKLAATDVLSCTQDIQPYQLEREGLQTGLIFDTPGYGETSSWLDKNLSIVDNTDLLLLVCAAHQSARLADRRFLATFQQHFQQHTQRKLPPIIVVVNHIDVLRPTREWQPPYDLTNPHPDSEKAKNILAAIAAIQTELALSPDTAIIPISLGDNAGLGAYNLEALILAMSQQMDDAHLTRLLRCLNTAKNRAKWPQLWQQLSNSGRWLVKSVDNVL